MNQPTPPKREPGTMVIGKCLLPQLGDAEVIVPDQAVSLTVGFVNQKLYLWWLADMRAKPTKRRLAVLPEGQPFPEPVTVDIMLIGRADRHSQIITASGAPQEPLSIHVFEVFPKQFDQADRG